MPTPTNPLLPAHLSPCAILADRAWEAYGEARAALDACAPVHLYTDNPGDMEAAAVLLEAAARAFRYAAYTTRLAREVVAAGELSDQ